MVLIWLGPGCEEKYAKATVQGIVTITDFVCEKVEIPKSELSSLDNIYQEVIFRHRDILPVPDEGPFSTEELWKSLLCFFSQAAPKKRRRSPVKEVYRPPLPPHDRARRLERGRKAGN